MTYQHKNNTVEVNIKRGTQMIIDLKLKDFSIFVMLEAHIIHHLGGLK